MWLQRILYLSCLCCTALDAELVKPEWWWTWTCSDGHCLRSQVPSSDAPPSSQCSLDICRLTCGQYSTLWPLPTKHTAVGHRVILFHPNNIRFDLSSTVDNTASHEFLYKSTDIFINNLKTECGSNCTYVPDTKITIKIVTSSSDLSLSWRTEEGYSLELSTKGNHVQVKIEATTVFGARHGLESLSQLTAVDRCSDYEKSQLVMLTEAHISDRPAYPHRGLLLDTARNFLPLKAMFRTIDAMAASKLNVLHWHATDSQSFPLESPSVPQLARYGAYSAEEVYRQADVSELLDYAQQRGVRVMLEIDGPAHAGNGWQWGRDAGLGDLAVCVNQQPWRDFCIQPPCGQLNPANNNLYRIMRDLFKDIRDMFPYGGGFHMGGDEVFFPCWNSSQQVLDWMRSQHLDRSVSDFVKAWAKYQQKLLDIWDDQVGHTKTPIVLWSSHLTDPITVEKFLDKDRYVIETWVNQSDDLPTVLLSKGYRVILATKDAWYLDHGFWGHTTYHNWKVVYENKLPREYKGVLGGEVAMWGELVDEFSLDSKVWPRAAAMAERVWSDPDTSSAEAEYRFLQHRERLVRRGINAEALTPEWCYLNDGLCR